MGNELCGLSALIETQIEHIEETISNTNSTINTRLREVARLDAKIKRGGSEAVVAHNIRLKESRQKDVKALLAISRTLDTHKLHLERTKHTIETADELSYSKELLHQVAFRLSGLQRDAMEVDTLLDMADDQSEALHQGEAETDQEVLSRSALVRLPEAPTHPPAPSQEKAYSSIG